MMWLFCGSLCGKANQFLEGSITESALTTRTSFKLVKKGQESHQAVSSIKMPSFSSCMNSSPPGENNTSCQVLSHCDPAMIQQLTSSCDPAVIQLSPSCQPTAETLQDEVELSSGLEGIEQVHDEGVSHCLQDLPLCSGVGCVFGVTDNFGLEDTS